MLSSAEFSSDSSSSLGSLVPPERQTLVRQHSDHLLSYYQSEDAGRTYIPPSSDKDSDQAPHVLHTREPSFGSPISSTSSGSDYSSDSDDHQNTGTVRIPLSSARKRQSIPTEGGEDRRRVAIVQMHSFSGSSSQSITRQDFETDDDARLHTLRSRRNVDKRLGGLALIAPPDASPQSYSHLTPPCTAPMTNMLSDDKEMKDLRALQSGHKRAASEAVAYGKSPALQQGKSRELEVFGQGRASLSSERPQAPEPYTPDGSLKRNPSQFANLPTSSVELDGSDTYFSSRGAHHSRGRSTLDQIFTPDIGEEKDIHAPVAPPVIVSLSEAQSQQVAAKFEQGASDHSKTARVKEPLPSRTPPELPPVPASYLHYQPGTHSTAGPLPPPPKATFAINPNSSPPPRPPRLQSPPPLRRRGDVDAVKQALQLPPSTSSILSSSSVSSSSSSLKDISNTSKITDETGNEQQDEILALSSVSDSSSKLQPKRSVHRREGAFPPSVRDSTTSTIKSESEECSLQSQPSSLLPTVPQQPTEVSDFDNDDTINLTKAMNYANTSPQIDVELEYSGIRGASLDIPRERSRGDSRGSSLDHPRDPTLPPRNPKRLSGEVLSRTSSRSGATPSPPPKGLRNSLTNNLKRLSSLPRPPSVTSSRRSHDEEPPRTPSPAAMPSPSLPSSRPIRKIRSRSPSAMFCTDIVHIRNTMERCTGYAQKINELYVRDCGLSDWVMDQKYGGDRRRNSPKKKSGFKSNGPSSRTFGAQTRHTSRASAMSEVSFPRRPDASTATDLTYKMSSGDLRMSTALPTLPYPSLAQASQCPPSLTLSVASPPPAMRTLASPTLTSKTGGGFFASLGRKASVSKGKPGRTSPTTSTQTKSSKTPPALPPRPVVIPTTPSVPGGPRALPGRMQRSQTIMISSPFKSDSSSIFNRSNSLTRSPSSNGLSSAQSMQSPMSAEFSRQVDKLADLLPTANRDVLAGYLRRSGQDILAIGQYLEDEKNGTIRYD